MPRILLVDDDAVLRVAVQNLAAALGWQVDLACDVREALQASLTTADAYDAAVVDAELPDGGGAVVADVVAVLHPGVYVVVQTGGWAETAGLQAGAATTCLPKERGPLALLDHLEGVLVA